MASKDKPLSKIAKGIKQRGTTGAFRKKAKAAGMSTAAYAEKVTKKGSRASTRTKRQANLAKTFAKYRRKKKG